jgi:methionyl aminopeptidase
VICHGVPNDRELRDGDILNIDVTTILDGYYGDTSRMFVVPPISDEAADLLKIAKDCLEIGIKQVRPGNYVNNIGYEIGIYAMLQRVSVCHQMCGHGVGLAFHEEPQVPHIHAKRDDGPLMRPGMIFTVEPMINLGVPEGVTDPVDGWTIRTADGKLSAQYEETVLVTVDGVEILTRKS